MSNRYLHKHKWIAVLLCLCFMMSFILPGYAMDGGVDAGGSDAGVADSVGDSGSTDIGSGDTGSGDVTGGGESGSGDIGSGGTTTGGEGTPGTGEGTTGGEGTPGTGEGTTEGEGTPGTGEGTTGGEGTPGTGEGTTEGEGTPGTGEGTTGGEGAPGTGEGTEITDPTVPGTEQPTTPQQPIECTCGTTTGVHAVDCPLYVAPECNCGTTTDVHAEGCPLYVPPVPVLPGGIHHVEGCTDEECTVENCVCPCHAAQALFERLMACGTIEEIDEIFAGVTEEEMAALALLSEEKQIMLNEYITALEPEPLPPVFIESEPPVPSEIVFAEEDEIVNMTDVAPFKEPVAGPIPMRPMRLPMLGTPAAQNDNGLELSKTATANGDGTYTIQLEAYATGDKVITEVTEDVPTDIVLVLDQSGSMDDDMGTVTFRAYSDTNARNNNLFNKRHNGGENNLYYPLGDGKYASVSVTVEQGEASYTKITTGQNNDSGSWSNPVTNYWNSKERLYALVGGEYQKVTVTRSGWSFNGRTYYYWLNGENGTKIAESTGNDQSPTFASTDDGFLYLLDSVNTSQNVYTYTYTDAAGETQTIGTSTGADTRFETTLYEKKTSSNGGDRRIDALTTALENFTAEVNKKAAGSDGELGTEDDVKHRIAMVGYASRYDSTNRWINTELFIGANQYNYNQNASGYYSSAFQDMNTTAGQANVAASIGALDANGATYTNYGLEMANGILAANEVPAGEERNRVVILFTDGYPGKNADDFNSTAAQAALDQAKIAKDSGTSVYSVGIFAGADASSHGDSNGTNTQAANWFMQNVSSNNGTPQTPSYYLSAADADSLNDIFQQIADNIETGGSTSKLDATAEVRDIISEEFKLPDGADETDIKLYTANYNGENSWDEPVVFNNGVVDLSGQDVSVSGFNYSEKWCGTETDKDGNVTYHGQKLIIEFKVEAKPDFLGGNNVETNDGAGIYANSDAIEPVETEKSPQVNVPIKDITVGAVDKNVYLLGEITRAQLIEDATATVGNVKLDLTKADQNYGLADWQTAGVDISVTITDADGNVVSTDLTNLREDTTYNVIVQVSPKNVALDTSNGEAAAMQSGTDKGSINVFKPELTFRDSQVWYGDTVPTDFTGNLTATKWKHDITEADTTTMGEAPALILTYTPDATKILEGKINTKGDINVAAKVKIGETDITDKTTFIHTACNPTCSWNETTLDGTPAFLLHPQTCQLTITKTGGADNEPYVFDVYKDGAKYSEVTIVGNDSETIYELPVGNYTIQEATNWSWRYSADNGGTASLTSINPTGSITCNNTLNKHKWLNGYSNVIENIFGVTH